MSQFIGTKEDFFKYVGVYCRNKVNAITRVERQRLNKTCQYCNKTDVELESAHIYGKDRKYIIEDVLEKNFRYKDYIYIIDLDKFENLYVAAHEPIEEHFHFLCKECHRKYDNGSITDEDIKAHNIKKYKDLLQALEDSLAKEESTICNESSSNTDSNETQKTSIQDIKVFTLEMYENDTVETMKVYTNYKNLELKDITHIDSNTPLYYHLKNKTVGSTFQIGTTKFVITDITYMPIDNIVVTQTSTNAQPTHQTTSLPSHLIIKDNETTQDYVKRVFTYFYDNNLLTDSDIQQLKNRDFCHQAFGIHFPLFVTNYQDIEINGHDRYWKKFKLGNKYYMCNHWQLDKRFVYIPLLERYILHILNH